MAPSDPSEQFVRLLTEHQNRLHAYIYSLLGDHSAAADVVQETNLVLWRKIDEFQPGRPFLPWAFAIARFQVLAHIRDRKRDRFLLDADLAETLCEEAAQQAEHFEAVREALRPCLETLSPFSRKLIEARYFQALPIANLATEFERTVGATKVALLRIRRQLAECVEQRIAAEGRG